MTVVMTVDLPRLEDLPELRGARVLLRADFNVPLRDGRVEDDLRITTVLPTLQWLREQGAAVVACGHLGRPKGSAGPDSTRWRRSRPGSASCSAARSRSRRRWSGRPRRRWRRASSPGDVMLLENLRFEPGETDERSRRFAVSLCEPVDAYVNEAFGASHRAHASIVGPPPILPSAGGRLLFREVEVLSGLLARPAPAVRRRARRREGQRQARRDRRAARALRDDPHRRGDGVHVPGRPGLLGRRLARGAGLGRDCDGSARDRSGQGAGRRRDRAGDRRGRRGPDRRRRRHPGRLEGSRHRARDRGRSSPTSIGGAATVLWNGPMGVFELDAVRGRHPHDRRGGRRLSRVHRDRWRRQRGGDPPVRARRPRRPRQHRRRRVARAHRAGRPPRSRRAAHRKEGTDDRTASRSSRATGRCTTITSPRSSTRRSSRTCSTEKDYERVDVVLCPPFTDLRSVQTTLESDRIPIALGAQNCHWEKEGAFTGEVSTADARQAQRELRDRRALGAARAVRRDRRRS